MSLHAAIPREAPAPHFLGHGRIGERMRAVPEPGPGELLVAARANAICGTERGQLRHGSDVTPGHEVAGEVVAGGPGTSTPPGTPGVIYLMDYCGSCRSCRAGATNQCLDKRGDVGFNRDGGYGPYVRVSERAFFAVDPSLSAATATLLLDVMGTARHALDRGRLACPRPEAVAVAGAGPVGLGVLAMSRALLGPDVPVAVADVVPYRLALVARLGGTPVDARTDTLARTMAERGLPAADLAVDTSGRAVGRREAFDALAQRGVLVCVGHGESLTIDVSNDLIGPERAILGSEYFPYGLLEDNHRLLLERPEAFTPILTHRVPVERLQEGMERFFGGETGKVVVEQHG